jgi:hypothetical protein
MAHEADAKSPAVEGEHTDCVICLSETELEKKVTCLRCHQDDLCTTCFIHIYESTSDLHLGVGSNFRFKFKCPFCQELYSLGSLDKLGMMVRDVETIIYFAKIFLEEKKKYKARVQYLEDEIHVLNNVLETQNKQNEKLVDDNTGLVDQMIKYGKIIKNQREIIEKLEEENKKLKNQVGGGEEKEFSNSFQQGQCQHQCQHNHQQYHRVRRIRRNSNGGIKWLDPDEYENQGYCKYVHYPMGCRYEGIDCRKIHDKNVKKKKNRCRHREKCKKRYFEEYDTLYIVDNGCNYIHTSEDDKNREYLYRKKHPLPLVSASHYHQNHH